MQRLTPFLAISSFVVLTATARAHADTPITITINSNNTNPTPTPPVDAPPPPAVEEAPPGAAVPIASCTTTIAEMPRAPVVPHRVLMLGVIGGHGSAADSTDDVESHGLRASVDLFAHRHFSFGIAGTIIARDKTDMAAPRDPIGSNVVAYVAYTHPIGRLDLRFEVGAGVARAADATAPAAVATAKSTTTTSAAGDDSRRDFAHVGEAAITISRMFGDRWGIAAGPVFTVARPDRPDGMADTDPHPAHTVAFFAALQRRL